MIEMPVCIHNVPIKYSCWLCKRKGEKPDLDEINMKLERIEIVFKNIARIEEDAQRALDLFIRKAHDLKKIDAKRDDVINLLCQKISDLQRRLDDADSRR